MKVKSNGNVGLGTSTVNGKLHIRNSNDGAVDQYSGLRFYPAESNSTNINEYHRIFGFRRAGLWLGGSANGSTYCKSNILLTDDGVFFGLSNGYDDPHSNLDFSVRDNGRVGIGTSFPGAKLHVVQNTNDEALKIVYNGWEDESYSSKTTVYDHTVKNYGLYYYDIERFYVDGEGYVYTNGIDEWSDSTLKRDIKNINSALEKVVSLRGVSYKMKKPDGEKIKEPDIDNDNNYESKFNSNLDTIGYIPNTAVNKDLNKAKPYKVHEDTNTYIGLLAQEVETVLPEVVKTRDNKKTISYSKIVALLIEAIKEQQVQIEELQQQVVTKDKNKKSASTGNSLNDYTGASGASLEQNSPNPFNETTSINYFLPEGTGKAALYVYDMQGNQQLVKPIFQTGEGSVAISAYELTAGMYMYSLVADGVLVGTKTMILTE